MKIADIVMVCIFSIGMGLGQLLLKFAAQRQSIHTTSSFFQRTIFLFCDWTFLVGVGMYALLLLYWIWLLTFLPLSRAYPFTLLSLVVAAVGSVIFFQEVISITFIIGLAIIALGLLVLSLG